MITPKLSKAIKIHRKTSCTIGRKPTCLITCRDKPAPIRKRVTVKPFLANQTIDDETASGIGRKVLAIIAKIKKKINQGILILAPFWLKINMVAIVTGMIHNARVSFTIVAISSAFSP